MYNTSSIISQLISKKMLGPQFKFIEVSASEDSVACRIDPKNPSTIYQTIKGTLHILIEVSSGMLLLQLHPLMYGINPNDQILYEDHDPNYKLILCLDRQPNQCWVLKVNQNTQLLKQTIGQRCKLINRGAANVISSKLRFPHADDSKDQKIKQDQFRDELDHQSNQSSQNLLIVASKALGDGMKFTGNVFARGFESLGNYLAKKVDPSEAVVLSDGTKNLVNKSLKGSEKILVFSQEQFAKLFKMGIKQAEKISNKAQNAEHGSGSYKKLKNTLKTGLHVVFNVYDGYSEGMSDAIKGLGKGSTNVVQAKYGPQAAQATYNVIESGRNIYNIQKVPKNQMKNYINPNKPYQSNNQKLKIQSDQINNKPNKTPQQYPYKSNSDHLRQ